MIAVDRIFETLRQVGPKKGPSRKGRAKDRPTGEGRRMPQCLPSHMRTHVAPHHETMATPVSQRQARQHVGVHGAQAWAEGCDASPGSVSMQLRLLPSPTQFRFQRGLALLGDFVDHHQFVTARFLDKSRSHVVSSIG